MKKIYFLIPVLLFLTLFPACTCDEAAIEEIHVLLESRYSSPEEFVNALLVIDSLAQVHEIMAFLDTLPDGTPDLEGAVEPLTEFISYILGLIEMNDLETAIHEVYHFDGSPFSLISLLMKAQMAGNIDAAILAAALGEIVLPPVPVIGFVPPLQPAPKPNPQQPCQCNPKVKIRVTWAYKPACGNHEQKISGYAAGNTLTNMRTGTWFRLDGEVDGCDCGGTWTNEVTTTSTSYGYSDPPGNHVGLTSYSFGEFKVKFTYKCDCGKEASETMTITF